jgi:hypothetical protein
MCLRMKRWSTCTGTARRNKTTMAGGSASMPTRPTTRGAITSAVALKGSGFVHPCALIYEVKPLLGTLQKMTTVKPHVIEPSSNPIKRA